MFCFPRFRILFAVFTLLSAGIPQVSASNEAAVVHSQQTSSVIVVGFVGGFVRHDNPHHGPVQFAQRLEQIAGKEAYVQVFENRHRKSAYKTILRLLDRDHDGDLSETEKSQARIILYGQSWGASAVVALARDLNRAGIPVLLTVQIDSVAKFWQKDGIIPPNVAAAVNFYQPHGIIHGRSKIVAADASRTQILGNYRFDYKQAPVECPGMSWYYRVITPGHMQSECDPHVWTRVEGLVLERLSPQPAVASAVPHP